jgi:UDP-2,4-diacetamido-2,4,6-trideoxy-beta-L-altropyranose hydrolase
MNSTNRRIVFRADGNSTIGLGHLIRSLALAEMLENSFQCIFIIKETDPTILQQVINGYEVHTLAPGLTAEQELSEIASVTSKRDIIVLDGYQFSEEYHREVKRLVHKLVCIDDKADMYFAADLVINHGSTLIESKYRKAPHTKLLLGFKYLMVRKPFREAALLRRQIGSIETVFICMGGADPFNITNKVLKAANRCECIKNIVVTTGSAYSFLDELHASVEYVEKKVTLYHNITANDLVKTVSECEIAVVPASSIAMEVCCIKAGLITGTVIDNQLSIHQELTRINAAVSVGDFNTCSLHSISDTIHKVSQVTVINEMMDNQSRMMDGFSDQRLVAEFNILAEC